MTRVIIATKIYHNQQVLLLSTQYKSYNPKL